MLTIKRANLKRYKSFLNKHASGAHKYLQLISRITRFAQRILRKTLRLVAFNFQFKRSGVFK